VNEILLRRQGADLLSRSSRHFDRRNPCAHYRRPFLKNDHSKVFPTIALCFFSNTLCFLDRINISIAAPFIMAAYGWNETRMGLVFSAFFAGYVLFMIPTGILADRYGARKVLASGVAGWSLFTFLTPFFSGIWTMSLCRFLVGAGQGVNFPSISNVVARRVPLAHRAKAQGFTLSGITVGSVLGFPLGSWIIRVWGWPAIFYVFGLLGIVWIFLWLRFAQPDAPGSVASSDRVRAPIPWKPLFTHPSSIGLTLSYFCHNYASYLFLVWLPTYLIQVHHFSLAGTGVGAAIPALAAGVFMNVSGWLSDHMIRRGVSREISRKLLLYLGMGVSGLLLLGLLWIENAYLAVALVTVSSAFKAVSTPVYWTLAVDMAPRHSGILSSIMNTSGNVAGFSASAVTGWMLTYYASWDPVLIVASGITLMGVVVAVPTIRSSEIL